MKAVVHLGLPKTGTTSLQHFLLQNAQALSERGVAYEQVPNPLVPPQDSQLEFGIVQFARAGEIVPDTATAAAYRLSDLDAERAFAANFERTFEKYLAARSEATYVISSEHIGAWTRTPEVVGHLDAWLRSLFDEVQYVLYIRRQEDWLASCYVQELRHGYDKSLQHYLDRCGEHDFKWQADIWRDGVGADRFTLRTLEPDMLVDGDLIADFASVVGFDTAGLPRPGRENEALTPQACFFLRKLNGRVGRNASPTDRALRQAVSRTLSDWSKDKPKLRLRPEQIDRVRELNAERNEALRAAYFPERQELFPDRPRTEDAAGLLSSVNPDQVAGIGIELMLQFLGELKKDKAASKEDA